MKFDDNVTLFSIVTYGCELDIISLVCFVRFYAFALFSVWLTIFFNHKIKSSNDTYCILIYELISVLYIYLAINNATLAIVVCAPVLFFTGLLLLYERMWAKSIIIHWFILIYGGVYYFVRSNIFDMILIFFCIDILYIGYIYVVCFTYKFITTKVLFVWNRTLLVCNVVYCG